MTFKECKGLLLKYPDIENKVIKIKKEIELIYETINAIREGTSGEITGLPKGNKISDTTYDKAEKIIDLYENRINELLDEISESHEIYSKLTDSMRELTPNEYKVIEARYIKDIKWDYIPGRINYSRASCFTLHDRAIRKIMKKISLD